MLQNNANPSANVSNTKAVLAVFEKYQKERLIFVQTVADLASREANIDTLQKAGVLALLRPLLLDSVPAIQHAAALALGRLANYNEELAEAIVESDILTQLVFSLKEQNRFYKKAAAFVLRAVAKHSPGLSQSVVDSGALFALVACLEEFDPSVKESAAWALGYIARHNAELSQAVVDAGAIPLLVLCVQEPELSLRRIASSALSDISKHSPELAQAVVDSNAISFIAPLLSNPDPKLRRQVLSALSQIAKHTVDLAETVVDEDLFPNLLICLKAEDAYVSRNAATLIAEISKHTPELAQLVVNSGGVAAVVDFITSSKGQSRLQAIMTLGYIAAFSETLALAVIIAHGVEALGGALEKETEVHIQAASAWALGQIGRHSSDHAKSLTHSQILPKLVKVLSSLGEEIIESEAEADLQSKCLRATKAIIEKTLELSTLQPLLDPSTPGHLLKYVVCQLSKILPNNTSLRREFVTSGGLQRIQDISLSYKDGSGNSLTGTKMGEAIRIINECYPEEVVRYFSPGYSASLLDKIDEYKIGQEKNDKQADGQDAMYEPLQVPKESIQA